MAIIAEAAKARQLLERESYDLVILDLLFGRQELSGLDVLDVIASLSVAPRVVIWVSSGETRFDFLYTAFADYPNLIHGAMPKGAGSESLLECVAELLQIPLDELEPLQEDNPFVHESMVMYLPAKNFPNPIEVLLMDPAHSAALIAIANGCRSYAAISERTGYKLPTLHHAVREIAERLQLLRLEEVIDASSKQALATVIGFVAARQWFFRNWGLRHPDRTRKPV